MTENEIKRAVEVCTGSTSCEDCPLTNGTLRCGAYFARHIAEKEKEPAPSANDTSSTKNILHLDDSTFTIICQAVRDVIFNIRIISSAGFQNGSDFKERLCEIHGICETLEKVIDHAENNK